MPGIDYSKRYRDYARFTPAISQMYVVYTGTTKPKRETPFPRKDLDFFDPTSDLFYLPAALYSAGQAIKSPGMMALDNMITRRDVPNTTVLGDSGGFQIQTGEIKFKGDETREKMMRWLEAHCDWSMILDFPTGGIQIGNIDEHLARLESGPWMVDENGNVVLDKDGNQRPSILPDWGNKKELDDLIIKNGKDPLDKNVRLFYTCMLQTMINNDYFVKNRTPGATNFLNVIQGRDPSESKEWYENIKHYPFEGWAMASHHKENFEMALGRILDMRDDGLLQNKDWMHFLGVGKFQHGCVYTTIQRKVRELINPNFTCSYDVSSPFKLAAFGKIITGYNINKESWSIQSEKLDGREFLPRNTYMGKLHESDEHEVELPVYEFERTGKWQYKLILDENGNKIPAPVRGKDADRPFLDVAEEMYNAKLADVPGAKFVRTNIGEKLVMGDICVSADPKLTSTWDVVSYAMMMNHNLQVHLEGIFESQDLYDEGDPAKVPTQLLELKGIVEEAFHVENRDEFLVKNRAILNCLASDNASRGTQILVDFDMPDIKEHTIVVKTKRDTDKATDSNRVTKESTKIADDSMFKW